MNRISNPWQIATNLCVMVSLLLSLGIPRAIAQQENQTKIESITLDNYSISGQVTLENGTPVEGVTITASKITNVLVQDEADAPVAQAQVFRNGNLEGTTDIEGGLYISGLADGDTLVARKKILEQSTSKQSHNQDSTQNWAYRVYVTSLTIPKDTDPVPYTVSDSTTVQVLVLRKSNTLIGFNILAVVEWDANSVYLGELLQGFQKASNYLYDATDGQMVLERVTINDNNQNMGNADYQIRASNQETPRGHVNGILPYDLHIFLGRYWSGESANQGSWMNYYGYSTQIHEFGHYGLGLYNSYYFYLTMTATKIDSWCTSLLMHFNTTKQTNATLMDYQYNATEFADRDVPSQWSSTCELTDQWQKTGKSDWEAILDLFRDTTPEPRWTLRRPANYSGVVSGPTVIPLSNWTQVMIGSDASTGVCEPPRTYRVTEPSGAPVSGAGVVLRKGGWDIEQGKTDKQGNITVLGAAVGDQLVVNYWVLNLLSKTINVSCGSHSLLYQDSDLEDIILQPAAFDLQVFTQPGGIAGQVQVTVISSVSLPSSPLANLTQHGGAALMVPLVYDGELSAYVGQITLDPNLPQSGVIVVQAMDAGNEFSGSLFHFQPRDRPAEPGYEHLVERWTGGYFPAFRHS